MRSCSALVVIAPSTPLPHPYNPLFEFLLWIFMSTQLSAICFFTVHFCQIPIDPIHPYSLAIQLSVYSDFSSKIFLSDRHWSPLVIQLSVYTYSSIKIFLSDTIDLVFLSDTHCSYSSLVIQLSVYTDLSVRYPLILFTPSHSAVCLHWILY